jgi:hypothetical protein
MSSLTTPAAAGPQDELTAVQLRALELYANGLAESVAVATAQSEAHEPMLAASAPGGWWLWATSDPSIANGGLLAAMFLVSLIIIMTLGF